MKAQWIAASALTLSFSVSSQAQAGFFKDYWYQEKLDHHTLEAARHLERHYDHKEDLQEVPHAQYHIGWHKVRQRHHWNEYQQHTAKVAYYKSRLGQG